MMQQEQFGQRHDFAKRIIPEHGGEVLGPHDALPNGRIAIQFWVYNSQEFCGTFHFPSMPDAQNAQADLERHYGRAYLGILSKWDPSPSDPIGRLLRGE